MEGLKDRIIWVPFEKLRKAEWNYKLDEPEKEAKLLEQIRKNGILETSLVRELPKGLYEVVDGNHRYDVYQELAIGSVPCFTLGKISLNTAKRIAIEKNETRFASDPLKLSSLFKEISVDFKPAELSATMPYSEEEVLSMIKLIDFDWGQFETKGADETVETKFRISLSVSERVFRQWEKLVGEDDEEKVFTEAVKALAAARK
jgi:ParB-like chromosome segregation protein Spo0J